MRDVNGIQRIFIPLICIAAFAVGVRAIAEDEVHSIGRSRQGTPSGSRPVAESLVRALERAAADESGNPGASGVPITVTKVALKLTGAGKRTDPQKLFDAVTRLKAATADAARETASKDLAAMLMPEVSKMDDYLKDGQLDPDKLFTDLTLREADKAPVGEDAKRNDTLVRALRDARDTPSDAKDGAKDGKGDPSAAPQPGPGGTPGNPGNPGDPANPQDPGKVGEPDPTVDAGLGAQQDDNNNDNPFDDLIQEDDDKNRNNRNNNKNNKNNKNAKAENEGEKQQESPPSPPSGGGGGGKPSEIPPIEQPKMPEVQAAPPFNVPESPPEVDLSKIADFLSGKGIRGDYEGLRAAYEALAEQSAKGANAMMQGILANGAALASTFGRRTELTATRTNKKTAREEALAGMAPRSARVARGRAPSGRTRTKPAGLAGGVPKVSGKASRASQGRTVR